MEDVQKLLEQNNYLMNSSDENESDNESSVWDLEKYNNDFTLGPNSIICKKRNGEKRLPTRRPDPNVYNRNALLARENRRKKKMYLETIEKELQMARKTNRTLAKALKRQLKITKRLEEEKKYFAGLIANRSEILTLVNTLNFRNITESESDNPPFSTTSSGTVDRRSSSRCDSFNDAESLSIQFDNISDGSVAAPIENSLCDFSSFGFCTFPDFFTDLEDVTDSSLPSTSTNLDDIWGENGYHIDNLIMPQTTNIQCKTGMQNINNDHCYIATSTLDNTEHPAQKSDTSDYINVDGDDIYCLTNNWNLTCKTPPLQLLSDYSSS